MAKSQLIKSRSNLSAPERILESVIHHCYKKGGLYVGLREIAKTADVAFGTVRYHFSEEGKDLLKEAIFYVVEKGRVYIDKGIMRAREGKEFHPVYAYTEVMFQWILDEPAYASFLVYYYYLSSSNRTVYPNAIEFLAGGRRRLEGLLSEAIGRDYYPAQKKMETLVNISYATLLGNWLAAAMDRKSHTRYKENTKTAFDLFATSVAR